MDNKNENRNIFKLLRFIRNKSIDELSKELDISKSTISSIESGRRNPGRRLLRDYAKALGVTPQFLEIYGNSDNNNGNSKFEDYLYEVLNEILKTEKSLG